MAGLAVAAFEEAARLERLAQFFQHRGAAAHHDAVGPDVERRLADIVEQLLRGDQVGDAASSPIMANCPFWNRKPELRVAVKLKSVSVQCQTERTFSLWNALMGFRFS